MSNDDMQPVDGDQELVDEISTTTETSNHDQELVDEWVMEIEGRLGNSHATRHPSMDSNTERLPSIIGKWQCWDDFGASFIPETLKWIVVACMTHYFGLNVRSYIVSMQEKVDVAWSYYRGVDQFCTAENIKHIIEHLLVNSCFLIFGMILLSGEKQLQDSWFEIINNKDNPKGITDKDIQNIINFIALDPMRTKCYMLTMNFQIPWFIVEAVYTELSSISTLFAPPIHKIAYLSFRDIYPTYFDKFDGDCTIPEDGFKHLLHIFHWSRTPDGMYVVDPTITNRFGRFKLPSATELELSQTVFKKDENGIIGVSYCGRRVIQLTPWHLFNYSPKLYESLLRFEELYIPCGVPFSSYVTCMASLLKTEADVRVLRANNIIPGTSFDDKAVLRCVQELKTSIDDNLRMPNELAILKEKVMAHHKRSVYRLIGEFKKRYCSNTWIIISVIAGISLFVLTFLQTLYGMLSYYNQ